MEYITLLDCNRQTSSEYLGGNTGSKALFTNKLGDGIVVNQGDRISVHNSFVSEVGADDNAINFGNKFLNRRNIVYTELSPVGYINGSNDKVMGYERVTASNITESVEENENSCKMLINYYKNTNGENYFALPRRFCWRTNMVKNDWDRYDDANAGVQNGSNVVTEALTVTEINSSSIQKYYVEEDYFLLEAGDDDDEENSQYRLRNNNSRHKIMIQTDTRYGNQITPLDPPNRLSNASSSTPANLEYIEYIEKLPISLPKGFISPSAISEKIISQLRSTQQPQINSFRSTVPTTLTGITNTTIRPLNVEFNSPTYHTFYSANESTNNLVNWNIWDGYRNDTAQSLTYLSTFQYIGVKRPDLWLAGRQFTKDWMTKYNASYSLPNKQIQVLANAHQQFFRDLNSASFDMNASMNDPDTDLIITNWRWGDKDIMKSLANVFKEQGKHPELFINEFNVFNGITTKDNSRFLHMNQRSNASRGVINTNQRDSLGWDYVTTEGAGVKYLNSCPLFVDFNPDYEDIETDGISWEDGYSYGVFLKYTGFRLYDLVAFTVKKLGTKMREKITNVNASLTTTIPRFLFKINNPSGNSILQNTNLGWDINFNSYGNSCIGLTDGWCTNMYNESEIANMLPTAFANASVKASNYSQKIYLGANEPALSYNTESTRFEITNLHTAERVQNYYNAGGVKTNASGDPETVVSEFATAGDKVYKINKRLYNTNFTPSILPYDLNGNTITIKGEDAGSYKIDLLNTNLEGWTIYDQYTGIIIKDFGYDSKYWNEGIWGTLGFTYEQFNTPRTSSNDINTRVGNSNKFALPYAFTNAEVGQLDTMDFITNVYGAGMYSLQLPSTMFFNSVIDAGNNVFRKGFAQEQFPPITESAVSVVLTAPNLPRKLKNGYYCIRSDIIDGSQYIGGANSGELFPVIAVVPKSNDFGDFYVGGESTLNFVFTKPKTISSVTTSIHNPNQTLANVDDSCAVIYKITRTINNNLDIIGQIMEENNNNKKK